MEDDLATAVLLHRTGRLEEAAHLYRQILAREPANPDALHLLGIVHHQRGEHIRAAELISRAVALRPTAATYYVNLAEAHRALGQSEQAVECCRAAVRLRPALAQAHAKLGLLLRAQRKVDEALAPLRRAADLEPNNALFWEYLAELYGEWSDTTEAVRCWRRAVELQPAQASMHLGLSAALLEAGQFAEAEEHIRAAMRLQPDSAAAQFGLANLQEQLGDMAAAEAAFRAALRLYPGFGLARVRLARLLHGRLPPADVAALEEQLADAALPPGDRIPLLFAMAAGQDALGNYGRAASCARQSHALCLEQARRLGAAYDPEQHRRRVDGILQAFGPEFFRRTEGGGLATERPVFVVGLPRSGTTLVEQILASHSRVYGAGELSLARQSLMAVPGVLGRAGDPLACVHALDAAAVRQLAEQHLAKLAALDGGRADRVIDKMPHNYQLLGLLAALFPRAVFIHCRRDPRDVAVSCWFTYFAWLDWLHDASHIATRFAEYGRLMAHWSQVLPVKLYEVNYEDIVGDLEESARRLVAACELEWEPACLEFHRTRRPVRTASAVQVRTPIYKNSVGRWKHYERELADLFAALASSVTQRHTENKREKRADAL